MSIDFSETTPSRVLIEDREDQIRIIERFDKNISLLTSILLRGEESGNYKEAIEESYLRSKRLKGGHEVRLSSLRKEIGTRSKQ